MKSECRKRDTYRPKTNVNRVGINHGPQPSHLGVNVLVSMVFDLLHDRYIPFGYQNRWKSNNTNKDGETVQKRGGKKVSMQNKVVYS